MQCSHSGCYYLLASRTRRGRRSGRGTARNGGGGCDGRHDRAEIGAAETRGFCSFFRGRCRSEGTKAIVRVACGCWRRGRNGNGWSKDGEAVEGGENGGIKHLESHEVFTGPRLGRD